MKRALGLSALVAAVVLASAGASARAAAGVCPTSNPPNELVLAGGSGQQAQLGKQFEQNLQVELANTNGCPLTGNLAGFTVNFDAPGSGASGIFASSGSREAYVGTNSQGVATAPPFTANFTVGNYSVDAHSDYGTVEIGLSNTANGLPAAIAPEGSNAQEASVNTQYAQPLQVQVTDANGAAVQGATVSFAVIPGATGAGATFLAAGQASATTNADGVATSPPLLANGMPGKFSATASTAGLSSVAMFALDNHAAAMTLSVVTRSDPVATVDTPYRDRLQARVVDSTGQPLEGATVTFAITTAANGAGASFLAGGAQATALTDSDGRATSPALVADKTAGPFIATASLAGAQPLAFTLTNLPATPHTVTAGAANGQSTPAGARFPISLAVTVTDTDGNPVKGAVVVFAAPAKGATGRFTIRTKIAHRKAKNQGKPRRKLPRTHPSRTARVATNAAGIAVAPPLTANASVGGYAVTATVVGGSVRAAFSLVNLPRG